MLIIVVALRHHQRLQTAIGEVGRIIVKVVCRILSIALLIVCELLVIVSLNILVAHRNFRHQPIDIFLSYGLIAQAFFDALYVLVIRKAVCLQVFQKQFFFRSAFFGFIGDSSTLSA